MSAAEQARALVLLKRWRDLTLAGGEQSIEDEVKALATLFMDTEMFLVYDMPIGELVRSAS